MPRQLTQKFPFLAIGYHDWWLNHVHHFSFVITHPFSRIFKSASATFLYHLYYHRLQLKPQIFLCTLVYLLRKGLNPFEGSHKYYNWALQLLTDNLILSPKSFQLIQSLIRILFLSNLSILSLACERMSQAFIFH